MSEGLPRNELSAPDRATLQAIRSQVTQGELEAAGKAAREALDCGLVHPFLFGVIAMALETAGQIERAVETLDAGIDRFPEDLACHQARGLCLLRLERPEAACQDFEAVTRIKPDFAPGHVGLGQALEASGRLQSAEARYRRALELDGRNLVAEAGLASLLGRRGEHVEARERALRVLATEPNYPPAAMVAAEADIAEKKAAEAEARMRTLVQDPRLSVVERSLALSVLGDALDRQDRPAEAFAAYSESNQMRRVHYAPFHAGENGTLAYAKTLLRTLQGVSAKDLFPELPPLMPDPDSNGHAFLIGFPRSGTTLLEQALGAHPRVATLEERETLRDAVSVFMKDPAGLIRLGLASDDELAPFVKRYWQRVAEEGVVVKDRTFVDKHPLNGLKLPLIARMFPNAKILLAIRDPRDVVLSCFRRRFRMSAPYYEMLSLDSASELYDCVMEITHRLIEQIPSRVHVVQLEKMIQSFEHESRNVCEFLEIGWSERMLDFASVSRERGVATASGAQIARGLNAGGMGVWRRYREQLEPVMPILGKWVDRFGYAPD